MKILFDFCKRDKLYELILGHAVENFIHLKGIDYSKNEIENEEISQNEDELEDGADLLSDFIKTLKKDLYFSVEYPYTDKMYRDSYYSYYSSLNRQVDKNSIRVCVFDKEVHNGNYNDLTFLEDLKEKKSFLGYFIIRPEDPIDVGRILLSPAAFNNNNFISCLAYFKASFFGIDFSFPAFPHASQDGIVHSCAETSIWTIMEYFGTRYDYYGTVLPSTILRVARKVSYERMLPSRGLSLDQIGFVLRKFGFGSRIYAETAYPERLKYIINVYVESGIPIIALGQDKDSKSVHSVVIIGHEIIPTETGQKIENNENNCLSIIETIDVYEKRFVIIDDNKNPYIMSSLNKPFNYHSDKYINNADLIGIVAPLYPKIYLDAVGADSVFNQIIKSEVFGLKNVSGKIIIRKFLTSSNSFKREIRKDKDLKIENKNYLTAMVMPKFIWLAELCTPVGYDKHESIGFIVLDGTSSSLDGLESNLITAFYTDRIIMKIDGVFDDKTPSNQEFYNLYKNNLKNFNTFAQ